MMPMKSDDLLVKIMDKNGLSKDVVAKKLGVSRRSINRLLKGEKASGKMTVSLIALYLSLNPSADWSIQ